MATNLTQNAFDKLAHIIGDDNDIPDFAPRFGTLSTSRNQAQLEQALSKLTTVSQDRDSYYRDLELVRDHYLVRLVVDVIAEDIFVDTPEGYKIDVECTTNSQYDKELKNLFDELSIPELVGNIAHDLIFHGEYSFYVENEGEDKGITKIKDSFEAGQILGIYNSDVPVAFYARDSKKNYTLVPNKNIFHIVCDPRKIALKIDNYRTTLNSPDLKNYPKVRVGRSVIHSALSKLKELMTKEFIDMMLDLAAVTRPTIVGISLPDSVGPKEIVEITRKYEKMLNENGMGAFDSKDPLKAVTAMMEKGVRIRVLPEFSNKGSISKMEINDQLKSDPSSKEDIRELRNTILATIGVPDELIFGDSESKRSTLKRYVRYAKKIKAFQRSIARALSILCVNHISTKYNDSDFNESDVVVSIYNPTNLEELDDLEGTEMAIQNASSVIRLLEDYTRQMMNLKEIDPEGKTFDTTELTAYIKKLLKNAGSMAHSILVDPEENQSNEQSDANS